jgi:AbrB family looped-hinge helix DNA binding protein
METTRLSTKGQVILPKKIRTSRAWVPGTEFIIEETGDGILLRPARSFPPADLNDVAGCLPPQGKSSRKAATLAEMQSAIASEVNRRHGRGRY